MPTVGYADEYGNETPRTDDMRALFDAIINDDPLPEEKNPDNTPVPGTPESTTSATPDANPSTAHGTASPAPGNAELVDAVTTNPQDITVRVSNSTGENGLAATAATELQSHGFNVTTPDDYPGPLSSTTVFFSPGNEQAAATVASSFTNPTIERVTGLGDVVQVVLGSDFYSVTPPVAQRLAGAGPCRARHQQRSDTPARGSDRHQRGRYDVANSRNSGAGDNILAGGIHLSFTARVVTIRRNTP